VQINELKPSIITGSDFTRATGTLLQFFWNSLGEKPW